MSIIWAKASCLVFQVEKNLGFIYSQTVWQIKNQAETNFKEYFLSS